ncbi:transmembrane protein 268 [Menidia menidia]
MRPKNGLSSKAQDRVTSQMTEDNPDICQTMEETAMDVQTRDTKAESLGTNARTNWSNGQCVVAMPSSSSLNPSFDLSLCRANLEREGFEIPPEEMEDPLNRALDVPSVRRYMVFNSGLFHFIMAPVLYVVVWCAVFSTLHLYITVSDYWVLCLSVSLISIFLTTAVIFILNHSNKGININVDVRLVQVNERMLKHKLLVGVADWVQNCTGHMQLYFVYWDMSHCLRTLTEILEEQSFTTTDIQRKMRSRMSHLIVVAEIPAADLEAGGSGDEQDSDENRPLLRNEDTGCVTASSQTGAAQVTTDHSLVPDAALSNEAKAYQLLLTYSAAYVKMLMSDRLSGPSKHRLRPQRNHCTTASICLCQYIKSKILQ